MTDEKLTFWTAIKQIEELSDGKKIDLENIKVPYILKDKLLMKEGTHNGVFYPRNELKNADVFEQKFSLYHDHNDASDTWIGEVVPKRMDDQTGEMFGDVVIIDKQMAMNLAYGAKLGLSPTIDVDKLERPDGPPVALDPQFLSWSTVIKPAVRETMLNSKKNMEETQMEKKDIENVANRVVEMLSAKQDKKEKEELATKKKEDPAKEELEKMKAENEKMKAELGKIEEAKARNESIMIRTKEEFLSQKEDEFTHARDEEIFKMEPVAREALSGALDRFIDKPEELSKLQSFVKQYLKDNQGKSVADATKAYKAEALKKKEAENKNKKKADLGKKEGISSRQSLNSQGSIENTEETKTKKEKQELSSDEFDKQMHQMMLDAQGGN